jgi:peptidyl-prolyl cis-trans isomerase SurA
MEDKIWNAASKDSVALQEFYNKNKANYVWQERVDAIVATASKKKDILKVKLLLEKGNDIDDIEKAVNADDKLKVIFTKDIMTKNHQALSSDFEFKKGVSNIYMHNDAYHVALVKDILPKTEKTLEEARGFVVTDFQESLEKLWLKSLKNKYKVSVNEKILNAIKKQLKN